MKKIHKATCRYNLAKNCFIFPFCLMGINPADLYNATKWMAKLLPITEQRQKTVN